MALPFLTQQVPSRPSVSKGETAKAWAVRTARDQAAKCPSLASSAGLGCRSLSGKRSERLLLPWVLGRENAVSEPGAQMSRLKDRCVLFPLLVCNGRREAAAPVVVPADGSYPHVLWMPPCLCCVFRGHQAHGAVQSVLRSETPTARLHAGEPAALTHG